MPRRFKFIDLFSGCGGWSEGFKMAGFECVYSIDNWQPAVTTHAYNHAAVGDDGVARDILDAAPFERAKELIADGDVDVLIGSPPCTAFSFANRGGNGNVVEGMVLVRRYLELVDFIQNELELEDFPWVLENVPRLADFLTAECVDSARGVYEFNYIDDPDTFFSITIPQISVLNAADYGACQKRRRCFAGNFVPPLPTHSESGVGLPRWRTLRDVLSSLPDPLAECRDGEVVDPNYPEVVVPIGELNDHFYDTRLARGAELYETHELKQHHPVYGVMGFPEDLDRPARTIMATEMRVARETMVVPCALEDYRRDVGKRPYMSVLEESDASDVRGFRRLTLRESACLQGFPITYQFSGQTSGVKHKQIGNAVSPIMARAMARSFLEHAFGVSPQTHESGFGRVSAPSPRKYRTPGAMPRFRGKRSFLRHLRFTKSGGQRIDLSLGVDGWSVVLTLGSGKQFKKTPIRAREAQILRDITAAEARRFAVSSRDPHEVTSSAVERLVRDLDMASFNDFEMESCFDADGRVRRGTPLHLVEEGLEESLDEALAGFRDVAMQHRVDLSPLVRGRHLTLYNAYATLIAYEVVSSL